MHKILRFWFPVVLYSGMIFLLSSQSNVRVPIDGPNFDKVAHIILYTPLGFLWARALRNSHFFKTDLWIFYGSFLFVMIYGMSDEYHQSFVVGRSADYWDVVADSIGGAIGILFYRFLLSVNKK